MSTKTYRVKVGFKNCNNKMLLSSREVNSFIGTLHIQVLLWYNLTDFIKKVRLISWILVWTYSFVLFQTDCSQLYLNLSHKFDLSSLARYGQFCDKFQQIVKTASKPPKTCKPPGTWKETGQYGVPVHSPACEKDMKDKRCKITYPLICEPGWVL